jgi:hypothetical protein
MTKPKPTATAAQCPTFEVLREQGRLRQQPRPPPPTTYGQRRDVGLPETPEPTPTPTKRDARADRSAANGLLRDDLDLRRGRPQVIRVERHEEVRPGIWRYTVPGFGMTLSTRARATRDQSCVGHYSMSIVGVGRAGNDYVLCKGLSSCPTIISKWMLI